MRALAPALTPSSASTSASALTPSSASASASTLEASPSTFSATSFSCADELALSASWLLVQPGGGALALESAPMSRGADGRECVGHRLYGAPLESAPRNRRRKLIHVAPSVPPSHNARRASREAHAVSTTTYGGVPADVT